MNTDFSMICVVVYVYTATFFITSIVTALLIYCGVCLSLYRIYVWMNRACMHTPCPMKTIKFMLETANNEIILTLHVHVIKVELELCTHYQYVHMCFLCSDVHFLYFSIMFCCNPSSILIYSGFRFIGSHPL